MALSQEQLDALEFQQAQTNILQSNDNKQKRLECIRIAKDVLVENARSKPVNERDVSASDLTNFAGSLINYVNS